jgi:hypothetical protein
MATERRHIGGGGTAIMGPRDWEWDCGVGSVPVRAVRP